MPDSSSYVDSSTVSYTTLNSYSLRWIRKRRAKVATFKVAVSETLGCYLRDIFDLLDIDNNGLVELHHLQDAIHFVEKCNGGKKILGNIKDIPSLELLLHKQFDTLRYEDFCLILTFDRKNFFESSSDQEIERTVEIFLLFTNDLRRKDTIHRMSQGEFISVQDSSKLHYYKALHENPKILKKKEVFQNIHQIDDHIAMKHRETTSLITVSDPSQRIPTHTYLINKFATPLPTVNQSNNNNDNNNNDNNDMNNSNSDVYNNNQTDDGYDDNSSINNNSSVDSSVKSSISLNQNPSMLNIGVQCKITKFPDITSSGVSHPMVQSDVFDLSLEVSGLDLCAVKSPHKHRMKRKTKTTTTTTTTTLSRDMRHCQDMDSIDKDDDKDSEKDRDRDRDRRRGVCEDRLIRRPHGKGSSLTASGRSAHLIPDLSPMRGLLAPLPTALSPLTSFAYYKK
eukprot:gene3593-7139_t